jgi:AcrR family transcriptional regulator
LLADWFTSENLTKGQRTQLRVILSAIKLFGQSGVNSVTLQQIGEDSDTSHPLILKHFGSKEDLLLQVRKYVSYSNHSWVDSKILDTMNGFDCLKTHVFENINWAFHNPSEARIILLTYYYGSLENNNSGELALQLGWERMKRYVLQAQREGRLIIDIKIDLLVQMVHAFALGLFTHLLVSSDHNHSRIPQSYKRKVEIYLSVYFY